MRKRKLKKRGVSVDKSVLAIPTKKRIVDHEYRKSFKGVPCEASRNDIDLCGERAIETVVGAHINDEEYSGTGQKADDSGLWPLCYDCHFFQTNQPGASWWLNNVLKPMARRRYRDWLNGKL